MSNPRSTDDTAPTANLNTAAAVSDGEQKAASWKNAKVAVMSLSVAVGMLGMSFAAVPLYRIFCQVTGFGGTTQVSEQSTGVVLDRKITVRFNSNVANDLGWSFKPVQTKMDVKIGETVLAFYRARNDSDVAVTGTASFNVVPEIAGSYFAKIECFCFTEQTLKPGQSIDMPVTFYVDPDMVKDRDSRNVQEITLSYTFHKVEKTVSLNGSDAAVQTN